MVPPKQITYLTSQCQVVISFFIVRRALEKPCQKQKICIFHSSAPLNHTPLYIVGIWTFTRANLTTFLYSSFYFKKMIPRKTKKMGFALNLPESCFIYWTHSQSIWPPKSIYSRTFTEWKWIFFIHWRDSLLKELMYFPVFVADIASL